MSNQVFIEQHEVTVWHSRQQHISVVVYDDYNSGDAILESIFEDDLQLLLWCKNIGSDMSDGICDVLDGVLEHGYPIIINGAEYTWDKIKHIFEVEDDEEY